MNTDQLKQAANSIVSIAEQAKGYQGSKELFLDSVKRLNSDYAAKKIKKDEFDKHLEELLKGRTREEALQQYDAYIMHLLEQISAQLDIIKKSADIKPESQLAKLFSSKEEYRHMGHKMKKQYLDELNIDPSLVRKFLREKSKRKEIVEKDYEVYTPNDFGKMANRLVGNLAEKAVVKYPEQFAKLSHDLRTAGFKVLSKTYVSMMIFSAIGAAIIAMLLASTLFSNPSIIIQLLRGMLIGIVAGIGLGGGLFIYPSSVASEKQGKMRAELPFVLIHMSAVAGSGAKPISIFQTLLTTNDYPALSVEIKKIVNYVNVFGYDLSTALRLTAMTTPSQELKDLLNGLINTISSGGDLKQFLTSMSQDALTTYQLERKKAVEVIGTYSDVYTTILIAAPLLFFVTLAIIQMLGGTIGGMSVQVVATVGTYGVIPLLNIGYIIFISAVQPK